VMMHPSHDASLVTDAFLVTTVVWLRIHIRPAALRLSPERTVHGIHVE
jgi:hypothetical protein